MDFALIASGKIVTNAIISGCGKVLTLPVLTMYARAKRNHAESSQNSICLFEGSSGGTESRAEKIAATVPRHPDRLRRDDGVGGPSYKRNDEVEVGFASQKHFIGLYILRTDVMNAHRHLLEGKASVTARASSAIPNRSRSTST